MLLRLLLLALLSVTVVCAITVYIKPSEDIQCPRPNQCYTLSEFVEIANDGFFESDRSRSSRKRRFDDENEASDDDDDDTIFEDYSNVSVVLLPGDHILDTALIITYNDYELRTVSFSPNTTDNDTTITCRNRGGFDLQKYNRLSRRNSYFTISDLTLISCSIDVVILSLFRRWATLLVNFERCVFHGTRKQGGIVDIRSFVEETCDVQIMECSFLGDIQLRFYVVNSVKIEQSRVRGLSKSTGSISLTFSGVTSVQVLDTSFCFFTLSSELIDILRSNVIFEGTSFYSIKLIAASSSIVSVQTGSSVTINESEFSQIEVPSNISSGGNIIFVSYSSIAINSSTFTNSSGNLQSVLSLVQRGVSRIDNSIFDGALDSDNFATIIESLGHDILQIENTSFVNNNGHRVLHVERTRLNVNNSIFTNNTSIGPEGSIISFTGSDNTDFSTISFAIGDTTVNNNNLNNAHTFRLIELESAIVTTTGSLIIEGNIADRAIIHMIGSTVTFSGQVRVSNNVGTISMFFSAVTFVGRTVITNNSYIYYSRTLLDFAQDLVGGALTCYESDIHFSDTVEISNNSNSLQNGGGIIAVESNFFFSGNVTISNNSASKDGGGIYALQGEFNFMNSTSIINNTAGSESDGGGMFAAGTHLQFTGIGSHLKFINNNAMRGGGLFLSKNAKLDIIKETHEHLFDTYRLRLEFVHNSAKYGGAMFVDDTTNSGTCASTQNSTSDCFIQTLFDYRDIFPSSSTNLLNIYFTNNTAVEAGKSLFGGLLDRCALTRSAEARSLLSPLGRDYFMNITNASLDDVSSSPVLVCPCENNQPACDNTIISRVSVQKGHPFKVQLVAVDQAGRGVSATIRSSLHSGSGRLGDGQFSQMVSESCTELQYNVFSPLDADLINVYADGPCNDVGISQQFIDVEFLPCNCPIGFEVTSNETECICGCESNLLPFVTECNIEDLSITRDTSYWFQLDESGGYITYPACPFDYCRPTSDEVIIYLNSSNSFDVQCAFNRSGILCGGCSEGLSVTFGSSQCRPCSDNWIALLIVFSVAGVALVVFLLVFNFTVAVGTLNGLIFYANVVGVNGSTLLPFKSPSFSTIFIAWLNLDFGFEACFYDGMDTYVKTWLRLAFPAYIIFLVIMIIVICSYSQRFSKLLSNRNPVATLATLILLSYASLLRTLITIFAPATIRFSDGSSHIVWLADGNVDYFGRVHIFLAVTSSIILVFGLAYTIFLLSWQWILKCPNKRYLRWIRNPKLYSFMDTYHAPFNLRYRYWTGFLLLIRVVLYIILVTNIGYTTNTLHGLFAVAIVCCVLFIIKTTQTRRAYKSQLLDILENSSIFNALLFSVATYHVQTIEGNQILLAHISVGIAFVTFLIIFAFHAFEFAVPERWTKKLKDFLINKKYKSRKRDRQVIAKQFSNQTDTLNSESQFDGLRAQLADIVEISDTSFCAIEYRSVDDLAKKPRGVTHTVIDGIPYEPDPHTMETELDSVADQTEDIEISDKSRYTT